MTISGRDNYAGVELRHLRALVGVARCRSFSRAAVDLGYAQSAISQQIASLERLVGARLFERSAGPGSVQLTAVGEVLAQRAERVLAEVTRIRADIEALAAGATGSLSIGVFQSAGARILPEALRRFRETLPGVAIHLREDHRDEWLVAQVVSGNLDVAFAQAESLDERTDHIELVSDRFVLLAPADSPLRHAQAVSLPRLDGLPMLAYGAGTPARSVRTSLEERGVTPDIVFTTDDNLTLQRLVGAGLGHAIVGALAVEPLVTPTTVIVLELEPGIPPRRICLAWARARPTTAALDAFLGAAMAVTGASKERSPSR